MTDHQLDVLAALANEIAARRSASSDSSYTAKLLSRGVEKCAKKFGEEAVELAARAAGAGAIVLLTFGLAYMRARECRRFEAMGQNLEMQ